MLHVVTQTLPNAAANSPYEHPLVAAGGTPPYSWSINAGSLPPGVNLNADTGVISGTPGDSGTFNFSVFVNDSAEHGAERGFALQVGLPNNPPVISDIPNQSTPQGQAVGPVAFIIGDAQSPADTLTLERSSSNQSIVRNSNIVFGGSFSNRTVTITPEPSAVGVTTITIGVNDGQAVTSDSFTLTIEGGGPGIGDEPNVQDFMVIKGQEFIQTNAASFSVASPSNAVFQSSISFGESTSVTNVLLRRPNGSTLSLRFREDDRGEVEFEQRFATAGALDSAFPNGSYALLLDTANDGTKTNSLGLSGSYPPTPRISNFTAAQSVNPSNDFTLTWDALVGVTTNDLLIIEIRDCNGRTVVETPAPGKPGALLATNTGVLIPARTLRPGQQYDVGIIVARITARDTTSHPGALGLAGYFKQLQSKLGTIGTATDCPVGDLRLVFTFRLGSIAGGTLGTTTYPQDFAFYTAHFRIENDPNPPTSITFTGPGGSSLNNTGTGYFGTDGSSAMYSSHNVNTPPYPPGGTYSVNYKESVFPHQLLDPNAAGQKVQLVPNIITNGAGEVTALNWTYRDANGGNVGPQPFMRRVYVRLNGANGPLFPNGHDKDLLPGTTNVVIDPPVLWSQVNSIQTGFEDNAGNEFLSDWLRASPTVQITTFALPGGVIENDYSRTLTAFGGSQPYAWSITSGNLPTGLELNPSTGQIFGVLLGTGVFTFNVRVTDDDSQTADRTFTVRVTPPGPDVAAYVVAKGRRFLQGGSAPPAPQMPGFGFVSFVDPGAPERVSSATIKPPGSGALDMASHFDQFELNQSFTNQATLDGAFPNGVYDFAITTVNDGFRNPALLLTNNLYPISPRVANWAAAHAIDASGDFTLSWDSIPGGGTNEFIILTVKGDEGGDIFSSPGFLDPERMDGTQSSFVIPSGTLAPGATYRAQLLFARRSSLNTTTYPNAPGLAAYFAETEFTLTTLNPAGRFQFSAPNFSVAEDALTATITVHRVGGAQGEATVDYTTFDGTAYGEVDYFPASGTLTFAEGVTSRTFTVTIENDEAPEAPETFHVALSNPAGGADLGQPAESIVTLLDNDLPAGPNVKHYVAAKGQAFLQTGTTAPAANPEDPFRFGAFAREAFPGAILAAAIRNPASVTNAFEHEGGGDNFEFNAGFTTKAALDAAFRSGVYTFLFDTLVDGPQAPSVTLPADAYPTTPHLANWAAAQSFNAFADFRVSWDPFAGGSAADYIQFSLQDTNTHEEIFRSPDLLEAGALNGTNTSILIPGGILQPGTGYEGKLLFAKITSVNNTAYPGVKGLAGFFKETRFTITTATPPPPGGQIQFAEAAESFSETNSTATVSLMRVGGSEGSASVTVTATNGTATSGADFAGASVVVTFEGGQTNATFTFEVFNDETYEGPETVKLFLTNPTGGATLAGQTNELVTILDNEFPPQPGALQFSAASYNVAESAGTVTITITRTGGNNGEVTVDYSSEDGSATSGDDYSPVGGTLTFPNGVSSRTFTIEVNDDDLDETNEVLHISLSNPSNGAALGVRDSATVVITDNDTAGVVAFSAVSYTVNETGNEATITLKRTGGAAGGVTVDYEAAAGSAEEELDFGATSGTVEFGADQSEATFTVPVFDDSLPEGNETLTLSISNATGGARLGAITNATLTIVDDEVVLQFTRISFTNSEALPAVTLTVTRSGPTDGEVTVDYATLDDSALAGEDYTETTGTLTFAPGVTTRTFTVPIINDTIAEETESFFVTLVNPSGTAQLGPRDTAEVTIIDNDLGGVISFSAANFKAKEGVPQAVVTVTRTGGKAGGVTVDFEVADGTAEDGSDYTATNGTLTFEAGVTKLTFTIPIIDDTLDETDETIELSLSNPTGGGILGERSEATVTIADNDVAGSLRFSAPTYSVNETGTVATITVLRGGGKSSGVTVDYATADGTATEGDDYTETSGTLTFGFNELSKTFTVPVLTDGEPDGNKTVLLTLRNPGGGAKLSAPTNATLTIFDSVPSVQFASATYNVTEGTRSIVLTVVRSGPPVGPLTVRYATTNGTATAGSDYTARSGTLSFSASATTATVTIPITNDTLGESAENFTVTLTNPSGTAMLGSNNVATVTIADNDLFARSSRRVSR